MVFKDNLASRSFKLPLRWFNRIGWIFGTLTAAVILLALLSARYAVQLRSSDSGRIEGLEEEIEELQKQNETLQGKLTEVQNTPPPTVAVTDASPVPGQNVDIAAPSDAAALPADALSQIPAGQRFAFVPPNSITQPLPATDALPFTLTPPTFAWRSRMLSVKFAFQYIKGDGGKQEGRFMLLARGPSHLLTYPEGALPSSAQGTPLIQPQKGEFFSVSRYREVMAEFGPVGSSADLTEVQVLIFNSRGELILSQTLKTGLSGEPSSEAKK